ncbi:MAG: DNA mismatch repair protein MutS [Candidatus Heimdallarchaeaceae archaeon]
MKRSEFGTKTTKITPMMRQWYEIKSKYKDYIIFFRAGDFYETFNEDAKIASKVLNITLTARNVGDKSYPLAGVPYHAVDGYIAKMVANGYKVAIVEQLEDPKKAKKIVKRGVVQLVTKGTIVLPESIGKNPNYLVSITREGKIFGLAALDLSTGEFFAGDYTSDDALSKLDIEIARLQPSEILVEEGVWKSLNISHDPTKTILTYREDYYFDVDQGKEELCNLFNTLSLEGFGIDDRSLAVGAAGAIIRYIKETQMRNDFPNIVKITPIAVQDTMILDTYSIKSLELVSNLRDGSSYGTLIQILDNTKTAKGSRLLHSWLLRPLLKTDVIQARLDATEVLMNDIITREDIRDILGKMSDIERVIGRICLGKCRPRDLLALKTSLMLIPTIKNLLKKFKVSLLHEIENGLDPVKEAVKLIDTSIADEVPASLKDGGVIKEGFNSELDELRKIQKGGKSFLASLEAREKRRTGIKTLKVKFNKVFGYYIEVPKSSVELVPPEYERKQTLVNAERYITQELKEFEEKILNAEERILELEEELYQQILEKLAKFAPAIQNNAYYCAVLDVITTFAYNASYNNYVKPEITQEQILEVKNGRHPVVEKLLREGQYIPNDCYLDEESQRIIIITGPNMGGKSTYLRQIALIVLLAQIGSFVPADYARIGIVDRIFTRIGAHDVLVEHRSTFMQEMYECANILNNATERSLIILDEVGRGTSTFDGVAIAWSITEYLHNNIGRKGPRVLFATHYHELIELEDLLPRVKNYHVAVKNIDGDIHFLYKVKRHGIDESYGVHVASLAGLPEKVVYRSYEILDHLHAKMNSEVQTYELVPSSSSKKAQPTKRYRQTTLLGTAIIDASKKPAQSKMRFKSAEQSQATLKILEELSRIDVNRTTPIEALNLLDYLVRKSRKILKER